MEAPSSHGIRHGAGSDRRPLTTSEPPPRKEAKADDRTCATPPGPHGQHSWALRPPGAPPGGAGTGLAVVSFRERLSACAAEFERLHDEKQALAAELQKLRQQHRPERAKGIFSPTASPRSSRSGSRKAHNKITKGSTPHALGAVEKEEKDQHVQSPQLARLAAHKPAPLTLDSSMLCASDGDREWAIEKVGVSGGGVGGIPLQRQEWELLRQALAQFVSKQEPAAERVSELANCRGGSLSGSPSSVLGEDGHLPRRRTGSGRPRRWSKPGSPHGRLHARSHSFHSDVSVVSAGSHEVAVKFDRDKEDPLPAETPRSRSPDKKMTQTSSQLASGNSGVKRPAGAPEIASMNMGAFQKRAYTQTNDQLTDVLVSMQSRCGAYAGPAIKLLAWWNGLQEPPRTGRIAKLVKSSLVETVVLAVILLNGAFIFYSTNYAAANLDESSTAFMTAVEVCFVILYSIELVMKLYVHGLYFFVNAEATWNCFDFALLLLSVTDLIIFSLSQSGVQGVNLTVLRSFRLLRISRVVRLFRALRLITELRLMLDCLMGCVGSLLWSLLLLFSINSLFGLIFVQGITSYLTEHGDSLSNATLEDYLKYFGSVQNAMIALYQSTSGGVDWSVPYEVLSGTGAGYGMLFIFYITFNTIAVWNIMTSLFIDRAMKLAWQDSDTEIWNKKKQDMANVQELVDLVKALTGQAYDGTLTKDMFTKLQEVESFRRYFISRGIDLKDAASFFNMLCQINDDDYVDTEAFGYGCTRLKGNASSVDLHTHNFECKLMHQTNQCWFTQFQDQLDLIQEKLTNNERRPAMHV